MKQHKSSIDHLPFGRLKVNSRAQRRLIPAFVKKLSSGWDLGKVGVITVSIRDGSAYVVDGQHRVRAALSLGLHDTKATCHVFRDLSPREEAALFLSCNDTKTVSAFDRFMVGLTAGDPLCVETRDILRKHDLHISDQVADGHVACVEAVLRLASRGLLDETCELVIGAWGDRASAFERVIVTAAGTVLGHYNGELDRADLAKKLAKYRGGAPALRGDARGLADYKPISISRAAAELMVDTYNKGRRSSRLAPLS